MSFSSILHIHTFSSYILLYKAQKKDFSCCCYSCLTYIIWSEHYKKSYICLLLRICFVWLYELFFSFYVQISPYIFHVCVMWTGKIFSSTKKNFFSHFVIADFMHITHFSFFFSCLLFFSRKWCICICGCCNCCCRLLQSYFILFSSYCIHYILAVLAYLFTLGFWMQLIHNNE